MGGMRPTVYIETTVPSDYCDDRPELVADISRTRQWWDLERPSYECFISEAVWNELATGENPTKSRCLALVEELPRLAVNEEIERIASVYQIRKLMPKSPVRDALHLAIATFYRMDFPLTWNCQQLANANKSRHLRELNIELDLITPQLVTPYQLQPWENET